VLLYGRHQAQVREQRKKAREEKAAAKAQQAAQRQQAAGMGSVNPGLQLPAMMPQPHMNGAPAGGHAAPQQQQQQQ